MPELISWGPFAIQTGLLAVIAALLAGIIAVRILTRTYGAPAHEAAELLQNAAFIGLIIWKFGHVLFAPSVVWQRPLALLMMNGGTREAAIAVVCAIVYLLVKAKRQNVPLPLFRDLISFGAVAALFVYAFIDWTYGAPTKLPWGLTLSDPEVSYHPVSIYMALVALTGGVLLWMRKNSLGTGDLFRFAAVYLGAGLLIVSLFRIPQQPSFLWLSAFQWRALALAGIGIFSSFLKHNSSGRR